MLDKLNATFAFQQQALSLRETRQTIPHPILPMRIPRYQARDIDFSRQLKQAMNNGTVKNGGLAMAVTAKGHISGHGAATPSAVDLKYRCRIRHRWTAIPWIWMLNAVSLLITP